MSSLYRYSRESLGVGDAILDVSVIVTGSINFAEVGVTVTFTVGTLVSFDGAVEAAIALVKCNTAKIVAATSNVDLDTVMIDCELLVYVKGIELLESQSFAEYRTFTSGEVTLVVYHYHSCY